jgi:hypothetical protein
MKMARDGLGSLYIDDDRHGLPYLKDYRVGQVSTHEHDRPIPGFLPSWKEFAGTMHRDNVPIAPAGRWRFEEIQGPGRIINLWCTAVPPLDVNLLEQKLTLRVLLRNLRHILPEAMCASFTCRSALGRMWRSGTGTSTFGFRHSMER